MSKYTTTLAAVLVGVAVSSVALSFCTSGALKPAPSARDLVANSSQERPPITEMQQLLADALQCSWSDSDPSRCTANGYFDIEFRDGKNGLSLGTHYINPDYQHSIRKAKRERERAIKMVTTLLPEWKEGRSWLTATLKGSEDSYVDRSMVRINEIWVIVEHVHVNVSENGATTITVTDNAEGLAATIQAD